MKKHWTGALGTRSPLDPPMVTPKFLGILKIKTDISIAYHMVKFSGILKIKTDISIAYHMKSFMCHLTTNNKL